MHATSITSRTPAGGFFSAFTSTMSFLVSSFNACTAASSAGSALSRSAWASSAMAFASAAFSFAAFSCASTFVFVSSATAVSAVITAIISSTSVDVRASTGCNSTSSFSITPTCAAVDSSLSRPTRRRERWSSISARFSPRSRVNVRSSSR